jgi:hypothetical protein
MFVAHAPSGYILAASLLNRMRYVPASVSATIGAGITGALAPDLDLLYFFFVDHRQVHHHKYISHWPMFWLIATACSATWLGLSRTSRAAFIAMVFCLGGVLHVILDSVVGDIWWFAPFVDRPFSLFPVRAVFKLWWLNFILHWSFALELAICLWAWRARKLASWRSTA